MEKAEFLYHGTDGDNILSIMSSGRMVPKNGEVYFARSNWDRAFMHSGDLKRKASFVIHVKVYVPEGTKRDYSPTQGVRDTLKLFVGRPLRAEVLELYARKLNNGVAEIEHITDKIKIRQYLELKPTPRPE